ncbi:hypothetical protein Tco_0634224, partial [Tanacetum coccineum]
AYPDAHENLKLTVAEQMIPEEPVSSTGYLATQQYLPSYDIFSDRSRV